MSEMLVVIFLVYATSGITFGKKVCCELKMAAILKILGWWHHRWRHRVASSFSLYSCLGEVDPGSKLQGQSLVNKCQYHNCLSRLYMPNKRSQWITLFEIASQRSTSQAYWVTLALISNIANYLKYNYFWDCDGIDNVTLRLWKFSYFCSRHTVGVAGDDIMFHVLVDFVTVCVARLPSFDLKVYDRFEFSNVSMPCVLWIRTRHVSVRQ